MMMKNKQNRNESPLRGLRNISVLASIPMVMIAGLFVGYFFGTWVDKLFGISPWGKCILSILGVIAGFKQTIRLIRESSREND